MIITNIFFLLQSNKKKKKKKVDEHLDDVRIASLIFSFLSFSFAMNIFQFNKIKCLE